MITANLKGGLGNLMFQIAACLSVAKGDSSRIYFSRKTPGNIHWNNIDKYESTIFHKVNFVDEIKSGVVYTEPAFHYNELPDREVRLDGYFQSERYFREFSNEVRDLFKVPEVYRDNIVEKYADILYDKPVAVHVRRGDYVNLQHIHPPCSPAYYRDTMKQFPKGTKFLIFSDDIEWCKKIFRRDNFFFVEGNEDFEDLTLFSMCDNHIISNSTFGWWGAWLSENNDKKVIAPKVWFGPGVQHNTKDLIPEDWIVI